MSIKTKITEQFIPFELALKLKELGFDDECFADYLIEDILGIGVTGDIWFRDKPFSQNSKFKVTTLITAPLWQQAFDWFRENNSLICTITPFKSCQVDSLYTYQWRIHYQEYYGSTNNYEEARQICLQKLIEICQSKQK